MTTLLQQRVRASGTISPSLWIDGVASPNDSFDDEVAKVLDGHDGLSLRPDFCSSTVSIFKELQAKSTRNPSLPNQVLIRRRSIILGIMANTPKGNGALLKILVAGFLSNVKTWLSEALSGTIGGTDFLLHLLSSVTYLPVTKELIAESKMGKAIAQAEKSKAITESPNSRILREKIAILKDAWTKSVKANKHSSSDKASQGKRKVGKEGLPNKSSSAAAKKPKPNEKSKGLSTSDLLRKSGVAPTKVQSSPSEPVDNNLSAAEKARKKAKEKKEKKWARLSANDSIAHASVTRPDQQPVEVVAAKPKKRVRFAEEPIILNAHDTDIVHKDKDKAHESTWKDMKKKEHLVEKELLESAKRKQLENHKAKLAAMAPTVAHWTVNTALSTSSAGQPVSMEVPHQNARVSTAAPVSYGSTLDIPKNPTGFEELQAGLNSKIQNSSNPVIIPFFIPRPANTEASDSTQVAAPAPAPAAPSLEPPQQHYSAYDTGFLSSSTASQQLSVPEPTIATLEYLQTAGLPSFLVGSNIKALQTITSSPGLLQTFINSAGQYDEVRLKNLVQNLSPATNKVAPSPPMPLPGSRAPFATQGVSSIFQPNNSTTNQFFNPPPPPPPPPPQVPTPGGSFESFGPPESTRKAPPLQAQFAKGGYRGDQNTTDGNLHVSGFGSGATQDEIFALFSQYMNVTELVPKGTFCFINSNDPEGARRARQALNGSLVGGSAIKINFAVRKERDPSKMRGSKIHSFDFRSGPSHHTPSLPNTNAIFGSSKSGTDFENEVDDRGNKSTKNLFVAGYGQGTTEHEIRQLFNQFGPVTGTVMKNTYAFVNMSSKESAVVARRALMGRTYNGGTLRVNFAKESGRLGTSFDQTYNSSSYGSAAFNHRNV